MSHHTRREYGGQLLEVHQIILKTFEEIAEREGVSCVLVREIEKLTHKDTRTVRVHLKLMEMDKYGHFASNGKLFQFNRWEQ